MLGEIEVSPKSSTLPSANEYSQTNQCRTRSENQKNKTWSVRAESGQRKLKPTEAFNPKCLPAEMIENRERPLLQQMIGRTKVP